MINHANDLVVSDTWVYLRSLVVIDENESFPFSMFERVRHIHIELRKEKGGFQIEWPWANSDATVQVRGANGRTHGVTVRAEMPDEVGAPEILRTVLGTTGDHGQEENCCQSAKPGPSLNGVADGEGGGETVEKLWHWVLAPLATFLEYGLGS